MSLLSIIIIIFLIIKLLSDPFKIIPNLFGIICMDGLTELFLLFLIYLIRYLILSFLI
jgi:hypothetical protein